MSKKISRNCLLEIMDYRRPPLRESVRAIRVGSHAIPKEYKELLKLSDGMLLLNGVVRLFGYSGDDVIPSIADWNESGWKQDYQQLAQDFVFVAEDVFGDQYGYRFGERIARFSKFRCEGGRYYEFEGGLSEFVRELAGEQRPRFLDMEFIEKAREIGLCPSPGQHLAFEIPLVIGGEYKLSNATVEDISLHMGLLAQISAQNAQNVDGTRIAQFTDES